MKADDKITLGEIRTLHELLSKLKTIGEWKKEVSIFRDNHNLNDKEAINIANSRFNLKERR